MLKKIAGLFLNIPDFFASPVRKTVPPETIDYFSQVEQARLEWQGARARFDQISDPDLIDHAIYNIEAAERRYIYLLKKAKEEGANLYSVANEGGG